MHALVLTGSPNPRSSTAALAVVAGRSLSALGSSVDTVDLSVLASPGCPDDFAPGPGGTRGPNEDFLSRCDKLAREPYRCATMLDRPAPAAARDRV
ncbi:hypothetical protein [Streptomyces sp. NPDC059850]|uniref:hypothetical protein n=1 Tax=Streptomyces sp. NPDC059850 TaxID=3346970 RepID=UPI00366233D4